MPRRTSKTERAEWGTDRSSVDLHISPSECDVRELVAIRAYELYLQRETAGGDDVTDWLTAEAEVRSCLQTSPMYERTSITQPVNGTKKAATKNPCAASRSEAFARDIQSKEQSRESGRVVSERERNRIPVKMARAATDQPDMAILVVSVLG